MATTLTHDNAAVFGWLAAASVRDAAPARTNPWEPVPGWARRDDETGFGPAAGPKGDDEEEEVDADFEEEEDDKEDEEDDFDDDLDDDLDEDDDFPEEPDDDF